MSPCQSDFGVSAARGIDHHHASTRTGPYQRIVNLERLFTSSAGKFQQLVNIDAQLLRVLGQAVVQRPKAQTPPFFCCSATSAR